jgi:uncharacterized protein (DUF983 family)
VRPGPIVPGLSWVIAACSVCGNDNEQYPTDDFAPYVTIFLVLHLMVPILSAADRTWDLSVGFEMTLALPLFLIATLLLRFRLPIVKGAVIGFAWARGLSAVRRPYQLMITLPDCLPVRSATGCRTYHPCEQRSSDG